MTVDLAAAVEAFERIVKHSAEHASEFDAEYLGDDAVTVCDFFDALAPPDEGPKCPGCGHPWSAHMPFYWPTKGHQCRVGSISEEDTGLQCTCQKAPPLNPEPR